MIRSLFYWLLLLLLLLPAPAQAADSPETADGVIDRYLVAYPTGNTETMLALYAPNATFEDVSQRHEARGHDQLRPVFDRLRTMHTELGITEKRRTTQGERVVVEVIYTGTLDCAALGLPDHLPVRYEMPAVLLFEVANGKIRRQTDYLDFRTLFELQQSLQSQPHDQGESR